MGNKAECEGNQPLGALGYGSESLGALITAAGLG